MSLRVLVFLGSTREGRHGERVAKAVVSALKNQNHHVDLIDPLVVGDGRVMQPLHFRPDPSSAPEWMKTLHGQIQEAQAFVLVTPEYNCCLPPALTSLVDNFPPASYAHKVAAVVSYSMGPYGASRVIPQARGLCSELKMITIPTSCSIMTVQEQFDKQGDMIGRWPDKLDALVKELQWYTEALNAQKEKEAI